jgi:hypothetical protein
MHTRERHNEPRPAGQGGSGDGGDDLTRARADAEQLIAAADRAIERALSTNSEAFLAANRQRGGQ